MMFLVGSTPRNRGSSEGLCIDPPGHLKRIHMFHDHPGGDDLTASWVGGIFQDLGVFF